MRLRGIFLFELRNQLRSVQTWLFFAVLGAVAFVAIEANFLADARNGRYLLNSPFVIAFGTVIASLFWLLVAAAVAGEAAARDVRTRLHPLVYTTPIRKADYLGGRFLAAFVLNALLLLSVPAGILLSVYAHGDAAILGPFRAAAYLTAYGFIALPNALVVTAIQFSFATLSRRTMASYLASLLLLVIAYLVGGSVPLLDPIGVVTIGRDVADGWTATEKNTRFIALEGALLWNRLLWLGIAGGVLAFTHFRFRFEHPVASGRRFLGVPRSSSGSSAAPPPPRSSEEPRNRGTAVPRTSGVTTRARQTLMLAWTSFTSITRSWGALLLLGLVAVLALFSVEEPLRVNGVPLLPRTDFVLHGLTIPEIPPAWVIIPLLIVFWSGEVVWREREAGLSEIADAAPVPDRVFFLAKFLGLGLVLAACMAIRMAVGMLVQVRAGYLDLDVGRYLQVLFGLQLADYVLLALLALVVHVVVNQKYVGHVVAFLAYVLITVASVNGIGHELLVYGSDPGVYYTDMRGFGGSVGAWLWFKLYWTAWALLLAMAARLLWVRGRALTLRSRLQLARRRFTSRTAVVAAAAMGLILAVGGFIFYNTNVLNESFDPMARRAEYERRYGRYRGVPQPVVKGAKLHVEIHPDRRTAEIRGTYRLMNRGAVAIDSVHVTTVPEVETRGLQFDRPATLVRADDVLGHRIYALDPPLRPGDSLRLGFEVRVERRGFRSNADLPGEAAVVANGTFFRNEDWLPAVGYQESRELDDAGMRQRYGLAPHRRFRSLYDVAARRDSIREEPIDFEAVVGTSEDQIAVAPGALRRTWTEGGRRYFHYAADAPIGNEYAFLSADYAVREGQWTSRDGSKTVAIRIFHQPGQTTNVERMLRSVRASLDYYSEQFRPYPQSYLHLVARPGHGVGMHADASMLTFTEGFALLHPEGDPRAVDLPFSVVAHEVAHQWWGSYLAHARVEGAVLLSESLAQYSAYRVVGKTLGRGHLRQLLLRERRTEEETPRARGDVPLLRGTDRFHRYRKGPWTMYAVSEYVGEERVNEALRRLLAKHRSGSLLTTLDLYRELQAVTPDSLRSLLHDLFEKNTFWELTAEGVAAKQTAGGAWQVTLDVRTRKVVVDERGAETEVPMNDLVEVGAFAASGQPLFLQKQRIRSGRQTLTVTVPRRPARVGIDPHHLLMDPEIDDNVRELAGRD